MQVGRRPRPQPSERTAEGCCRQTKLRQARPVKYLCNKGKKKTLTSACAAEIVNALAGKEIPYFSDYETHFPPNLGGNGGASYSPNAAYLVRWGQGGSGGAGSQEAGAGPHFSLQIFPPYFPPLKRRCVLRSGASYSPKSTVLLTLRGTFCRPFNFPCDFPCIGGLIRQKLRT